MTEKHYGDILRGHELENVDIPSGYQKFKKYFQDQIHNFNVQNNLNTSKEENPEFEINDDDNEDNNMFDPII